ncbi:MAG: YIP1 family protein [Candidatus Nanohaloarchaea archaeon]
MSFLDDYLDSFENILTDPSEYYRSESRTNGFGFPMKFAAANIVLSAVFSAVAGALKGLVFSPGTAGPAVGLITGLASFAGGLASGLVGLFVGSAVLHAFAYPLGARNGFSSTLGVIAYSTVIYPLTSLLGLVPFVGYLASTALAFYGIYMQVRGVQHFQGLSVERSVLAVLAPLLLVVGLFVAILGGAFLTTYAGGL